MQGPHTPTYLKPRACGAQGLEGESERYDTKNREPLPPEVEQKVVDALGELVPWVDAVVIADQVEEEGYGVVTAAVRGTLAELADEFPEVVFWADSRRRIGLFRNVITKPNRQEAVRAAFPDHEGPIDDEIVLEAGRALCTASGGPVFVTRSERGILVFDEGECHEVRGVKVEGPIDPTGAGDSATAAAVLTLASSGTLIEAALMANLAASVTIQQLGATGVVHAPELAPRLEVWLGQR